MSDYIIKKLNWLNLEFLEKLFFALFLLSIPLQTRLTFTTPQTYANGYFNEYTTFFIYLSDIFLITTFFLFFVNSVQKFTKRLSRLIFLKAEKSLPFENTICKFSFGVNLLTKRKDFSIKFNRICASPHLIPIALLVGFILWSFLSVGRAEYQNIAIFQDLKLAELILLALYINNRLLWFGLNKAIALIFITGMFQAVIGIGQYLTQKSLGLKILGESVLAPNLDNVAKIVVDGERIIRAYGTFPHPNVFASFLILSISCGFWLLLSAKTKENSQIVSRETIWTKALIVGIILQLTALILTFSRVAWLGAVLVVVILLTYGLRMAYLNGKKAIVSRLPAEANTILNLLPLLKGKKAIVSRETIYTTFSYPKLFHVKQFYELRRMVKQFWDNGLNKIQKYSIFIIIFTFIVITGMFWNQITSRTVDIGNKYQQSINYRIFYNDIAIKMIKDRPITGIGNGNFTLKMKDYSPVSLEWWQYQPAHNIYLLIASELGLIGLIIFLLFIFSVIKMAYLSPKKQIVSSSAATYKIVSRETIAFFALNKEKNFVISNTLEDKRETIYNKAKEGETFLASAKEVKTAWLKYLILSIFIAFLFMGLFDHYFWTLQQGRLTFWLVIGMLLALNREK